MLVGDGAYSIRTTKGYGSDLRIFADWCQARDETWLPAAPNLIADFVDEQVAHYRVSTIKRRLCAIAFAHRMCDLPAPTEATVVRLAVRRAVRKKASRPSQVRGLTCEIRAAILSACPDSIEGLRDAALISIGYDTLCRSSELSAMRVEHISLEDRVSSILIPRSKSDSIGDGRTSYLSPETTRLVTRWLEIAGLSSGPLFRSLHLGRLHDGHLATSSIRRLIKRATRRAELDPSIAATLSGHSMRIGAAQDMLVAGFDALAIMQAGGWRSTNVVLRYIENAAMRELHERRWQKIKTTPA
jgi:integrase